MKHASPLLEALWAEPRAFSPYEAMLDLVNLATRRPTAVRLGRARILLERGELVTSEPALADRWRWSRKAVRTFLAKRRQEGELLGTNLASRKQGSGTKLTLVNYETYAPLGPKRAKDAALAKSSPDTEIAGNGNSPGAKQPPHTPPVGKTPLCLLAPKTPQGGVGGGVASARDVENPLPVHTEPDAQLDLATPGVATNPEHLRYAEEVASALNRAQAENGRVDRDTYRPIQPWHPGTLAAALALRNAGVPLTYATEYAWLEGQRFKPTARATQIASVAYLQRGCITAFRELEAKHRQRVEVHRELPTRPPLPKPLALGDVVAGLMRDVRPGGSS